MLYTLLISIIFQMCSAADVPTRSQPIGSIIVFRGDDVNIYGGGKKTKLEEKKMPYSIYLGDEIGTGSSSDCEILLSTNNTIYVSPESLVAIDIFKSLPSKISLRYGVIMFRGNSTVELLAKDFSGYTSGGDFLMKYKRSTFETTVLNFGANIKVKRDMDKEYMELPGKSFARLASFKEGKKTGIVKEDSIPLIYNLFSVSFKPEGSTAIQNNIPGSTEETNSLPYTKAVNLDYIKRTIGL
ncbi:MAG: hypothetical protein WCQ53_02930 [bacterium]